MNYGEYINALEREGAATARAIRAAGADAPVPPCPGWTVTDLVLHVGRLHRWVAELVVHRPELVSRPGDDDVPAGAALFDWFEAGYPMLATALRDASPEQAAWSWTTDGTVGFWARRQANELAVHRWDAQAAAGATEPIEHPLAVDGIDEFFALIPFWRGAGAVAGANETLHFHCTDGEGEWLVRLAPDGLVVTAEHAKGDVAARGSASDLLLFLYGRVPADALETFGDVTLLARWRELVHW